MTTTTTTTTGTVPGPGKNPGSFGFDIANVPDHDRDRVAALIPSAAVYDAYVGRTIDGVVDMDAFAAHLVERENVLIVGPASAGKTFAPRAFAALHGLPYTSTDADGGIDLTTLWGEHDATGDPARPLEYVVSEANLVLTYGGVWVVNEFNTMHERVQPAFNPILDDRREFTVRGSTRKVAFPSLVVATINPPGGAAYRGTREMQGATNDRFQTIVWDYDRGVESQLVKSSSLLDLAYNVRALDDVSTPLGTRALMAFERAAVTLGMPYAVGRLIDRFREVERAGVRRAVEMAAAAIAADLGL